MKGIKILYDSFFKEVMNSEYTPERLEAFLNVVLKRKVKIVRTPLEAWLTFMASDDPERIIELITCFPEFKPMYETLYQMCLNIERVMNMFSEELRILDCNTVKYMIEEQQQEIDKQREQLAEKDLQLREKDLQLKDAHRIAIVNMLHEHMDVAKIASLLACDISYVEQVKNEEKL